jgi:putative SOS response-associated peptidase YedK
MAFAGLWEHWQGPDGSEIESMVILTTPANRALARLHDRMPAILPRETFEAWLDTKAVRPDIAAALLVPAPENSLEIVEVSPKVNDPRNEGAEVQEPVQRTLL